MATASALTLAWLATALGASPFALRPAVSADGRTRTLPSSGERTVTRVELGLAAQLDLEARAATGAFGARYGAALRAEDVSAAATLRVVHQAALRAELRPVRRLRLAATASGQYGETHALSDALDDVTGAALPIRADGPIRFVTGRGDVAVEAGLGARSSLVASAGASAHGGASPAARSQLPLAQSLWLDARLAWLATRSDRLGGRAAASLARLRPGGDGSLTSLALEWEHGGAAAWGWWSRAGVGVAAYDGPGLSQAPRPLPLGEAGARFAAASGAITTRVAARVAPAPDFFYGGYSPRLEADASTRWRATRQVALVGTVTAGAAPWRSAGALAAARAEARVEWSASRQTTVTAGVAGLRQRDEAGAVPTGGELATFLGVAFEPRRAEPSP